MIVRRGARLPRHRGLGAVVGALVVLQLVASGGAATAAATSHDPGHPEIIGGVVAPPGSFPYQVALLDRRVTNPARAFFCGGSLISPDTVLTAAHCVVAPSPFTRADVVDVLAGTLDLASGGQRVHVRRIRAHAGFSLATRRFDVAVLQLGASLPYSPVVPAGAADAALAAPRLGATVAGWGATRATGGYPRQLRMATLPIRHDAACQQRIGPIYHAPSMLCVGGPEVGLGTCWGDSGGPLVVVKDEVAVQVGIVSFAATVVCADGNPEAFGRVSRFEAFVDPYLDPDDPPDAPESLTTRRVPGGVELSWRPPYFDGGTAVTGYEIRWDLVPPAGGGGAGGGGVVHVGQTVRSQIVSGLTTGQRYSFELRAKNVIGWGPARQAFRHAG